MNIKLMMIILFIIILALNFRNSEADELYVVTTLPSLASITESIGGNYVEVYSITRGVQDAHYVEAKPSYMIKLHKADLLIYSGLELEIGWLPLLIQGARNHDVTVGSRGNLNVSLALPLNEIIEKPRGEVDRSMGDVHPAGNPHYLLNPYNGILVGELIAERLSDLDPKHKKEYAANYERFEKKLNKKIKELEHIAKDSKGSNVVCYHVHWSYLLNWLGLKVAGYIELRPGIPPTPRHKREIIQLMKDKQIKVAIVSSWKDPKKAKEVANASGAELLILPGEVNAMTGAGDYISWIEYMVEHLVDAFNQTKKTKRQIRKRERRGGKK